MTRRIVTAREQYEMLTPWRTASWTPSEDDPDELTHSGHPSGFSAHTFPGAKGDHRWIVQSPSGDNVSWGKAGSPEEAQAAALHTMDNPPAPYRYGPDDLEFDLYHHTSPTGGGGAAGVWSRGDEHGPDNWLSGITWGPDGTIGNVETKPDHQRKGLATQLFDYVKQNHRPDLQHSTTLTSDGAAWSKAEKGRNAARLRTAADLAHEYVSDIMQKRQKMQSEVV